MFNFRICHKFSIILRSDERQYFQSISGFVVSDEVSGVNVNLNIVDNIFFFMGRLILIPPQCYRAFPVYAQFHTILKLNDK